MGFDMEKALTMKQVRARMRGKGGKRIHEETLRRYCTKGCKLPDGQVARLKSVRIGGLRYVLPEWLEQFEEARMLGGMER